MKSKGQMQIALGIVALLVIVGGILAYNFFFGGREKEPEEPSAEGVVSEGEGAPLRVDLLPTGTLPAGTTQTKISVSTDESGYCRYAKEPGKTYDQMTSRFSYDKTKTFHTATVKSLSNGQTYRYYVRCRDTAGNKNSDDAVIEFSIGGAAPYSGVSGPSVGPDKVPPLRTDLYPTGTLPSATTETQISVNTNEPAYCRYSDRSGQSYDEMKSKLSYSNDKLFHKVTIKGLTDNKLYEFYIRCRDIEGNRNIDDAVIRFGVGGASFPSGNGQVAGGIPPSRFDGKPDEDLPYDTRQTTISLRTDKDAFCRYSTVAGMGYDSMSRLFTTTGGTFHSTLVTGLDEGKEHAYYVKCIDSARNKNNDDFVISFKVAAMEDATPPVRRNQYPTGDALPADTAETMIGISTDEPADCRYSTTQGTAYKSMKGKFSHYDETKVYHTAEINNLENGKSYNFFVRCKDLEGNVNINDVMIYFKVNLY